MKLPSAFADGITLRRAVPEDAGAMEAFVLDAFGDEDGAPDVAVSIWARDLLERPHPTFEPGLCVLATDDRTGEIVASAALIPQTWTYGGVPIAVGRPEIVGTRAAFRRRGLATALMGIVHAWSADAGDLAQAITGIPWFYRRYGYEMALDLGGGAECALGSVPEPGDAGEPCTFRPAVEADLPFLTSTYRAGTGRFLVATDFDDDLWRLELGGRSAGGSHVRKVTIIERGGEPIGMVVVVPEVGQGGLWVTAYELAPGVSWGETTPGVLRWLKPQAETAGAWKIRFGCGDHPSMLVLPDALRRAEGYQWYVRVPDVPGFVRHIAPVVERRLAQGPFVGHTGEIRLSFYTGGLRIRLERGRLASVEAWEPSHLEEGDLLFPDLTFLRILFGSVSLAELRASRADCRVQNRLVGPLVDAMFPRLPSSVLGVA